MQSGVILASQPYGLGLDETLMPQYLKELGYATHGVGKVNPERNTVKPVLSGHPWGIVKYPLNTGCPLNTGRVYSYLTGELIFRTLTSVRLIQDVRLIQGRLIQV